MTNRQIKDAEECEKMQEQGEDKDCFGCRCSVCIAQEQVSTREAMKVTLRHLFELIEDREGISFEEEEKKEAIRIMHDNDTFFDELIDFMEEHIEVFGENYGLKMK